ncbi:uncharacterized protein LOC110345301 [Heterocephalus glaber]|uniref:Uncharacterized protein LOC110345301 n=1 Tax=Heterocephalus glaber TaxID=10181 RepID=A0AAX6RRJ8_HETGA|nr:uncharacterized protein LOC110345301 [Heterocephalus glaber]
MAAARSRARRGEGQQQGVCVEDGSWNHATEGGTEGTGEGRGQRQPSEHLLQAAMASPHPMGRPCRQKLPVPTPQVCPVLHRLPTRPQLSQPQADGTLEAQCPGSMELGPGQGPSPQSASTGTLTGAASKDGTGTCAPGATSPQQPPLSPPCCAFAPAPRPHCGTGTAGTRRTNATSHHVRGQQKRFQNGSQCMTPERGPPGERGRDETASHLPTGLHAFLTRTALSALSSGASSPKQEGCQGKKGTTLPARRRLGARGDSGHSEGCSAAHACGGTASHPVLPRLDKSYPCPCPAPHQTLPSPWALGSQELGFQGRAKKAPAGLRYVTGRRAVLVPVRRPRAQCAPRCAAMGGGRCAWRRALETPPHQREGHPRGAMGSRNPDFPASLPHPGEQPLAQFHSHSPGPGPTKPLAPRTSKPPAAQ